VNLADAAIDNNFAHISNVLIYSSMAVYGSPGSRPSSPPSPG